jgi:predicted nucleic acid-binding protein
MSDRPIIADSGPLIALARVGQLDLLPRLFQVVRIPEAVMREVTQGAAEGRPGASEVRSAPWIEVVGVSAAATAGYELLVDAGEAAAIALAKSEGGLLLMDDDRGRRLAIRLGLAVKGTLGILIVAKRRGHIPTVRPLLEGLVANGIRLSVKLVEATLREAGESF